MELNIRDIENLLKLLVRTNYNGLEEAEVGVLLKHKLEAFANTLLNPAPAPAPEAGDAVMDAFEDDVTEE